MDMEIRNRWDDNSETYNQFVVKGFSIRKERESWQRLFSKVFTSPMNILDVGCGPGIVSMQLADLGHRVTALDFSEKMITAAKKNASDNNLKINFYIGDAEDLPFEDESFDGIVSDYMLWTVPHPEKVMEEWFRVLKPSGIIAYVDGNWSSDPKMTKGRLMISKAAVFIDSPSRYLNGRKKSKRQPDTEKLWSFKASRPEDDLEMMRCAGFVNIKIRHDIQKEVLHGVRYIAHGSTNDHFMVTAVKP